MRRPLADAGLFFILIILVLQLIHPLEAADYSSLDGYTLTVSGCLARREYKEKDGLLTTVLYLKNFTVTNSRGEICMSSDPHIDGEFSVPSGYSAMCYLPSGEPVPVIGSAVTLRGTVRSFAAASNPGNFDMRNYYFLMRTALSVRDASICESSVPVRNHAARALWHLRESLDVIRRRISMLCDLCFDSDDSSVIKAMILGDRSALSADTKALFSQNGISHILAISGLHISMLGMAVYSLLRKSRLPQRAAGISSVILMLLYVMMTGMAASAVRALIMFSMRMLAPVFGRTCDTFTALTAAAVTVLMEQPAYIFYSGFQFSFGAVAAILIIVPLMEDIFPKILLGGLSVNIATLPVYLYNYFCFPVFSVVLNLYVIPLMSLLLGASLISLCICAAYIPLGRIAGVLPHLILQLYRYSCRLGDLLPYNRFVTGRPRLWQILLYFVMIVLILIFRKSVPKIHILMSLTAAGLILTMRLPSSSVSVTLTDVGQGDGIYITNGCGADILVDGGSSTVSDVAGYRLEPYLMSCGAASLDAVFVTHMDSDHYSGILEMLYDAGTSGPGIDELILTSSTVKAGGEEYEALITAADASGIPVYVISQGSVYCRGGLKLYCLYPDSSCTGASTNDESLVLILDSGPVNVLLTGDLAGTGEEAVTELLESAGTSEDIEFSDGKTLGQIFAGKDVNILKVAHHGSKNSTFEPFLESFRPAAALISAGKDNSYGHPHAELLSRLEEYDIPYFCTIENGAVTLRIRKNRIKITGFIPSQDRDFSQTGH